jgi:hypothetical protein
VPSTHRSRHHRNSLTGVAAVIIGAAALGGLLGHQVTATPTPTSSINQHAMTAGQASRDDSPWG